MGNLFMSALFFCGGCVCPRRSLSSSYWPLVLYCFSAVARSSCHIDGVCHLLLGHQACVVPQLFWMTMSSSSGPSGLRCSSALLAVMEKVLCAWMVLVEFMRLLFVLLWFTAGPSLSQASCSDLHASTLLFQGSSQLEIMEDCGRWSLVVERLILLAASVVTNKNKTNKQKKTYLISPLLTHGF